ncbi:MAG: alkane 1-monooxygenase 2 [Caldimonas sp.]|uniref:alkane 1-monooxygenase n=1 Tax=Caldimonas taiwanensis TaxID=307483 RepID=UPI00078140EE|nr:alkane 1-monooxygenase [Caldimonas taiwanensis]GIX25623.1 MAG: alkane 1-monooxygenase 2 [Caldimonas sp.]
MLWQWLTRSKTHGYHRWGYLMFLLAGTPPVMSYWMASMDGRWDLWAWLTPLMYFGAIPLADLIVGTDKLNPSSQDTPMLERSWYYAALPLLCVPFQLSLMLWGAHVFATAPFGPLGAVGWIVSMGCLGGVLGINVAHELIHKPSRIEQWGGGLLLSSVIYGSFKIEHIYGHHVDVATPRDNSTARRGETVYGFIGRALRHNVPRAFELERQRAKRRGEPYSPWLGELAVWFGLSALFALACVWIAGHWLGLVYFVGQAFVAVCLLEIINYVEHYGLQRRQLPNGRYERVDPKHSWNSDYLVTNMFLFHLQRHSDHHAYAARRYQVLRHFDESPQLPFGYAAAVVVALCPPLWRRIMDPRVDRYMQMLHTQKPQPVA